MSTAMVCIEIPREILDVTHMTSEELRWELAARLFQQGRLSFGKAREMTGMTVWDFERFLAAREIAPHYDVAEYREDVATLKVLGGL
jgi:predicted HTH domain antitoxin